MEDPKQRILDSLKQANNILVTVHHSPTIDALAACIAFTLVLNELGKHGTAVFSGEVPSVLEFLEPNKTLERNTDSLQDFIISLDKAKADKLRYKVEDSVVKIFITPYKTSITENDLDFGQGDFNVDVVVALGVHNQNDLDQAITTHGRILHDATVISMDTEAGGGEDLGSINWIDANASSLSEMVAELVPDLGKDDKDDLLDNQVATALLTGIVSATERFGNAKTTSDTMQVAAKLLTAGANQELVATKLNEPQEEPKAEEVPEAPADEPADSHAEEDSEHADADALLPSPLADAGTEDANNSSAETATENPEGDTTDKPADEDTAKPAEPEPEPPKTTPGTLEIEHSADEAPAEEAGGDIALMPEPIHDGHGEAEDSKTDSDTSAAAETDKPAAESSEEPSGEPAATDAPEMPGLIAAMPQPATDTSSEEPAAEELAGNEPTEPDHETQAVAATGEAGPNTELGDKPADAMLSHHTVIQPIHDEPLAGDVPPQPDLDATKFALTPPSLGGTLTANDDSDKPLAPAGGSHPQILKHDALGQPPAAPSFDAQAAEAEPAVAPLPAPTAVTDAAPSEAGQPGQPSLAPEPLPSLIASPLLDGSAPAAPPAPEADAPAIPDPAQAPLDPSLATGQPIAPATPASAPADPVMKPADMPLPSPTLIPSIQSMPAPAPVGAAAPPTTPPPLQ